MNNPRTIALFVFLGVTVLTALAVLAAAVGWLPNANARLVSWGIPAVLGEIVATIVVYVKSPAQMIRVNLMFPTQPDLGPNASYLVLDSAGKERKKGTVVPILGPGGYQVTVPAAVEPTDSIALSFSEQSGDVWDVRPFLPYVQTQPAVRSSNSGGNP